MVNDHKWLGIERTNVYMCPPFLFSARERFRGLCQLGGAAPTRQCCAALAMSVCLSVCDRLGRDKADASDLTPHKIKCNATPSNFSAQCGIGFLRFKRSMEEHGIL